MRSLNEFERKVARKIANSRHIEFNQLFSSDFHEKYGVHISRENENKAIHIYAGNSTINTRNSKNEAVYELIFISNLMVLLENEGFIYSVNKELTSSPNSTIRLSPRPVSGNSILFTDEKLEATLANYTSRTIYPTEDLKLYAKSFRTKDEQKHQQILKIQWIAIIVSIFLGLYGVLKDA